MAQLKVSRNLSMIRKSGSTARILNLLQAYERHGETQEYLEKPIFRSRRLNRALIIKHTPRLHEMEMFESSVSTATKVIVPFASSDLSLGGSYFFCKQKNFDQSFHECVGDEISEADQLQDKATLALIDDLPSLDPFLLREGLRRRGLEPARCYFDIGDADIKRMTEYVTKEIANLVRLAFAEEDSQTSALARTLAEKVLSDENTQSLQPLRKTLQLSGDEYSEGMFAWKGFLYYKWLYSGAQMSIARVMREMTQLSIGRADSATIKYVTTTRERTLAQLSSMDRVVRAMLKTYDHSFQELTGKQRPMAFREFLLTSPAKFLELGGKLGSLMHIVNYWRFRFSEGSIIRLKAEEAFDLFQVFDTSLDSEAAITQRNEVMW